MKRIVLETTDRCNLACLHCFAGRHGGKGLLDPLLYRRLLDEARPLGFAELAFTGGEPTLHPRFAAFVELAADLGYRYGLVTNGWTFQRIYPVLLAHRLALTAITFSLDGECETTHDAIRGSGSFRRVLQAISICAAVDLPFTLNMVVMRTNQTSLESVAQLAEQLGARGIRFGHFIEGGQDGRATLSLTDEQRRAVERRIWRISKMRRISVAMAAGYYTHELFPCAPLAEEEINIDWQGNVSRCCHLSGSLPDAADATVGNLREAALSSLLESLRQSNEIFRAAKRKGASAETWRDVDFWPCDYCLRRGRNGAEWWRPIRPSRREGRRTGVACMPPQSDDGHG